MQQRRYVEKPQPLHSAPSNGNIVAYRHCTVVMKYSMYFLRVLGNFCWFGNSDGVSGDCNTEVDGVGDSGNAVVQVVLTVVLTCVGGMAQQC